MPKSELELAREELASAKAELAEAKKPVEKGQAHHAVPMSAPHIRTGEDPMSSRPFYISKAALVAVGQEGAETAKLEMDESRRLKKALTDCWGSSGTNYSDRCIVIPLSWDCMPEDVRVSSDFQPLRKAMHAAVATLDPDVINSRVSTRVFSKSQRDVYYKTAMSYLDQTTGGALVAPPEFGDLIPILRNKAVLPNIGATNVALPAQGSIQYPRQTGVTTFKPKPENTAGDESNPTYDDITLHPHQHIGLVRASNQLLKFAPGLAEASIRNDMAEQIALTFDIAGLEGTGGPNRVKGIINQTGIGTVTAYETGTNGDTWSRRDTARMLRKAMQRNSDLKTFIMRPDMWLGITETATDAVVPGDGAGLYLFNAMREFSADFGETLRQRKVVTSNQVSTARTKGSGTDLTYILGVDGQEILVGMHGAMVLDANPYETTAYSSNQTLLRAILFGDVQVRRGAGVVFMDDLIVPNLDA